MFPISQICFISQVRIRPQSLHDTTCSTAPTPSLSSATPTSCSTCPTSDRDSTITDGSWYAPFTSFLTYSLTNCFRGDVSDTTVQRPLVPPRSSHTTLQGTSFSRAGTQRRDDVERYRQEPKPATSPHITRYFFYFFRFCEKIFRLDQTRRSITHYLQALWNIQHRSQLSTGTDRPPLRGGKLHLLLRDQLRPLALQSISTHQEGNRSPVQIILVENLLWKLQCEIFYR